MPTRNTSATSRIRLLGKKKGKYINLLYFAVLLLAIPLTLVLVNHSQDIRQHAMGIASPQKPFGQSAVVSCQYIGGYSCDTYNYKTPSHVRYYLDGPVNGPVEKRGKLIGETTADQKTNTSYDDHIAGYCGGNPNRQFYTALPAWLKDYKQHTLYIYGLNDRGDDWQLAPSAPGATTFTCPIAFPVNNEPTPTQAVNSFPMMPPSNPTPTRAY